MFLLTMLLEKATGPVPATTPANTLRENTQTQISCHKVCAENEDRHHGLQRQVVSESCGRIERHIQPEPIIHLPQGSRDTLQLSIRQSSLST